MEKGHKEDASLIIEALCYAAKEGKRDIVDKKLVPDLKNFDADLLAPKLLKLTEESDPNIRDVAATCFASIKNITSLKLVSEIKDKMIKMAKEDEEIFPAGRAATVLLNLDQNYFLNDQDRQKIKSALLSFKERVILKGWKKELSQNIKSLKVLFL